MDAGKGAAPDARRIRLWQIMGSGALLVLVAAYLFFVLTPQGQALENAALRGADQAQATDQMQARATLSRITTYSLAAAVGVVGLIGLLRRRLDLAVAGVGTVVMALVITQVLKRFVLPRPHLVEASPAFLTNSFPSGHTTIALSVLLALVIVSSYRWRGVMLLLFTSFALSIGAATLTAKWHRLSDTIGADAIALAVACAVSLWLSRRGAVTVAPPGGTFGRRIFAGFLVFTALISVGLGLYLAVNAGFPSGPDTSQDWLIYLAFTSLASAVSTFTVLLFWWSWRGLEAPRPA